MDRRTKCRLCAEWLNWCLDHGWPVKSADALEEIFWKFDGWKTFAVYVKPPKTTFKFAR